MRFQAIIFDLDGTLLDTLRDIAESMNAVLEKFSFPVYKIDEYRFFVGEGIEALCKRVVPVLHQKPKTIAEFVELMKEEYQRRWQNNTRPYPGIPELLDELENLKIKMAVLSNKPDEFTKLFVKQLLPDWEFSLVLGEMPGIARKPSAQGALHIAEVLNIQPSQFIYLGDSAIDIKTANAAGMFAVGVLWGFRGAEELIKAGAKALLKKPIELLNLIK